jgi:hypothetical protein
MWTVFQKELSRWLGPCAPSQGVKHLMVHEKTSGSMYVLDISFVVLCGSQNCELERLTWDKRTTWNKQLQTTMCSPSLTGDSCRRQTLWDARSAHLHVNRLCPTLGRRRPPAVTPHYSQTGILHRHIKKVPPRLHRNSHPRKPVWLWVVLPEAFRLQHGASPGGTLIETTLIHIFVSAITHRSGRHFRGWFPVVSSPSNFWPFWNWVFVPGQTYSGLLHDRNLYYGLRHVGRHPHVLQDSSDVAEKPFHGRS